VNPDRVRVTLASAYSTRNPGDGLLVDLTLKALRRVRPCVDLRATLAIDPCSFESRHRSISPLPFAPGTLRKPDLLATARAVESSDAIVAVGGGYLRWESPREHVNCALLHVGPLGIYSRTRPTILMPQSVGPFADARGGLPASIARLVDRATRCYVRDDESVRALQDFRSVVRVPDLAVLQIAQRGAHPAGPPAAESPRIVLAPRPPRNGRGRNDEAALMRVARATSGTVEWAYQSDVGRDNSDKTYVQRLAGSSQVRPLKTALATRPTLVVAGRLHAALEAIMSGVPTIHLGYDRKSRGCYEDLGIDDWRYQRSNGIDSEELVQIIELLASSPSRYWNQLTTGVAALRPVADRFYRDLDAALAGELPSEGRSTLVGQP
jgi:polysaccharide pyruvyl transferase WcaK-like protein